MTEREKMLKGLLYNANYDTELLDLRIKCKDLCHKFNQILPSETMEQQNIIKKIIGKIEDNFVITAPFWCDYGQNISIGKDFYCNHNLIILDAAQVIIGDNVFIAPNCCISTAGHPLDYEKRNNGLEFAYPIIIGNNVWIGANVTILPGVTIGDNTVIGAGSVVTADIKSNKIAFGNPCKMQRENKGEKYDKI